ncbi:hypothetical protein N9Y89_01330 [bacterium]|nr:hypothetical protein [bacterium]
MILLATKQTLGIALINDSRYTRRLEQNNSFHDNYLEMGYDLSKVMFVATANSLLSPKDLPLLIGDTTAKEYKPFTASCQSLMSLGVVHLIHANSFT